MIGQWSHKTISPRDGVVAIMMSYYTLCVVVLCEKGLLGCQSQSHSNTIGLLGDEHHRVTGLCIYDTTHAL